LDPIAHTFTGAALAAAGLKRATPLASAALIMAANAPDVDVLAYFAGEFQAVAFRRGWTHGVLALALWPLVLTGVLLAWDRFVRRARQPSAAPARAGPLLALSALALLTHPTLDWMNNYGLRWLMPFDGRWFYGDALFIIDPWIWLTLGGVLFLGTSSGRASLTAWIVFFAAASAVVLANTEFVPAPARVLFVLGLVALAAARWLGLGANASAEERAARIALGVLAAYVLGTVAARAHVRQALEARGIHAERVMVAPAAANPFAGDVVASTSSAYYSGRWRWLETPQLELRDATTPRPQGAVFEAAARAPNAQRFLSWARFPAAEVENDAAGFVVRFTDMRYRDTGRLNGPVVRLDANLEIVAAD